MAQWDYGVADGIAYHRVYRQTQLLFSEINDNAEWGHWYWATNDGNNMTYQSGPDVDVRNAFSTNGKLGNSQDTNYRAISDNWPVFAFAVDLGSVDSSPVGTLFSIGLAQTDAVQYAFKTGMAPVPSLWTSYFSDDLAAVCTLFCSCRVGTNLNSSSFQLNFFHNDYSEASSLSSQLDDKIARDSIAAAGQDYLTITSLSARQAFGAIQLCGTSDKYYLFLKEISSNGNMNTVDVIFPAYPIFLYTNPALLRLLLEPLFENQESGLYPNSYAIHDLGAHYPNATGHPDGKDEPMPLEECGNMVIMALAYALRSKDTGYLQQHYRILKQWTEFLVSDALYPAHQISTDDFNSPLA